MAGDGVTEDMAEEEVAEVVAGDEVTEDAAGDEVADAITLMMVVYYLVHHWLSDY